MNQSRSQIVCLACGEMLRQATALLQAQEAAIQRLQARVSAIEHELDSYQGPFIASYRRAKFHRLDCGWAEYLNEFNSIEFATRGEAIEAGYKPCNTCCA